MDTDTITGSESLSIDQAAAAYLKSTSEPAVVADDHVEPDEELDSDTTTDEELQASEEDAGDETDGEPAEGEDDADTLSEDDEPGTEQGRFVADNAKVRLPDGTVTTVHELKRGNLREADYTRKTQEAAARQTETAAQLERIAASEKQLEQQRQYVTSLVKSIIPSAPDPSMADPNSPNYDPAGYISAKAQHESWTQHLSYLDSEEQRAAQERQAKSETETQAKVQKEWATALEKLPELKDAKRLEAFGKKTLKYGPEYGYSPQELANIHHDHRQLLVLKDAIAWRELQASKATVQKKVEGRPPITKGGNRLSAGGQQARKATDAVSRLKQTGSVEDAAAAYLASLNKG